MTALDISMRVLIDEALTECRAELPDLSFLPAARYDRAIFPTTGQYDWFSGCVLYALIRKLRPQVVVEFSTSSGYSTSFTGMALKRNGAGMVHSIDIDVVVQESAKHWFQKIGISNYVHLHAGDCRQIVPRLLSRRVDLLFIDTLHSYDMANWYLTRVIPALDDETVLQIHDVMPPEARVRIHGGPPYAARPIAPPPSVAYVMKRFLWLLLHGKVQSPFPARPAHETLPFNRLDVFPAIGEGHEVSIDGNYFEESVVIRELVAGEEPNDFVYLHRLVSQYGWIEPQKFAELGPAARCDSKALPLEWNEAAWMRAKSLKALLKRKPLQPILKKLAIRFAVSEPVGVSNA